MPICVLVCEHECRCLQSPEESAGCLGAGVTGDCELAVRVCAGNQAQVIVKSRFYSLAMLLALSFLFLFVCFLTRKLCCARASG